MTAPFLLANVGQEMGAFSLREFDGQKPMPRKLNRLNARFVETVKEPNFYPDGNNLALKVEGPTAKSWIYRYTVKGRTRDHGLGTAIPGNYAKAYLTLAEARIAALQVTAARRAGHDPIDSARAIKEAAKGAPQPAAPTFRSVADALIAQHEATWRNDTHKQQWRNTLRDYVFPAFGDQPVATVAVSDVLRVLEPIWMTKPETASRVRGRIEKVLDRAIAMGLHPGPNPAAWRGRLQALLPAKGKVRAVTHHAALPWREVGAFMAALRQQDGVAARALEFTVLTCARTGETIGAKWSEIDLAERVWVVPASRMKAHREHRVALPDRAVAIVRAMAQGREPASDEFVFPGQKRGAPLSNMAMSAVLERMSVSATVHGMRSVFRDWAAEATNFPRELAEAALAHTNRDKVESAYKRGDQLEKRRRMMEAWASFCSKSAPAIDAKVVAIGGSR